MHNLRILMLWLWFYWGTAHCLNRCDFVSTVQHKTSSVFHLGHTAHHSFLIRWFCRRASSSLNFGIERTMVMIIYGEICNVRKHPWISQANTINGIICTCLLITELIWLLCIYSRASFNILYLNDWIWDWVEFMSHWVQYAKYSDICDKKWFRWLYWWWR